MNANTPNHNDISHHSKTDPGHLTMAVLCDLWNQLSNICVSEDGSLLDETFLHFGKGSEVVDVWQWFEAQNVLFVAGEAGKNIGPGHPFRGVGLVEQALAHIASIHPSVNQVVYGDDLRWTFSRADQAPIHFKGIENISLLESAADEAYDRGLQNVVVTL